MPLNKNVRATLFWRNWKSIQIPFSILPPRVYLFQGKLSLLLTTKDRDIC